MNHKNKYKELHQVKSIDQHEYDLDRLILKLELEGFSDKLINEINNKKCKISILKNQLESSKLKTKIYYKQ